MEKENNIFVIKNITCSECNGVYILNDYNKKDNTQTVTCSICGHEEEVNRRVLSYEVITESQFDIKYRGKRMKKIVRGNESPVEIKTISLNNIEVNCFRCGERTHLQTKDDNGVQLAYIDNKNVYIKCPCMKCNTINYIGIKDIILNGG